ncbi:MAG: hypothetical protein Q4C70_13710 [Planctomycetia bacterium]|nr:hypothetical protein [Planctomycetia bacterium]
MAHVDLKRLNLVTATDTVITLAQKYLPKTYSEGTQAAQAAAVYKTLAATLNTKKEQLVKADAEDVYILLDLVDPMNPFTVVIPVGKQNTEKNVDSDDNAENFVESGTEKNAEKSRNSRI